MCVCVCRWARAWANEHRFDLFNSCIVFALIVFMHIRFHVLEHIFHLYGLAKVIESDKRTKRLHLRGRYYKSYSVRCAYVCDVQNNLIHLRSFGSLNLSHILFFSILVASINNFARIFEQKKNIRNVFAVHVLSDID